MSAPLPVRPRSMSASRIASYAFMPVQMSTTETPTCADGAAAALRRRRPAGDGGEPRLGLDQQVVGLALAVGAVVAVARDRAADQPRVTPAQVRDGKTQLGQRTGLQVLRSTSAFARI